MSCRRRIRNALKPGTIRETCPLSYGLDSEEDEQVLGQCQEEFPKYLSGTLLIDAWIHMLIKKIALSFLTLLIVAVISGLIVWPPKLLSSPQRCILQLDVKDKEEGNYEPTSMNRETIEMAISNAPRRGDVCKNLAKEEQIKGNDEETFNLLKGDEPNISKSKSTFFNVIKYKRECNPVPTLQDSVVKKEIHHKNSISSDHKSNENPELIKKLIDLEKKIQGISSTLGHFQKDFMYKALEYQNILPEESRIRKIVQDEIGKEKSGMSDFALENTGGSIIGTPKTKAYAPTTVIQLFGFPLWLVETSPRNAIQATVAPGECWTFHGSVGNLKIQLAAPVIISSFSLYHIPKQISLTGEIESAPREFSVIGIQDSDLDTEILLGEYEYDDNGSPLQTFLIQREVSVPFYIVELRIHSNYGNEDFTCIYRFQVHGKLAKK